MIFYHSRSFFLLTTRAISIDTSITAKAAVTGKLLSPVRTTSVLSETELLLPVDVSSAVFSVTAKAVGSASVKVAQPFSMLSGANVTASPFSFRVII